MMTTTTVRSLLLACALVAGLPACITIEAPPDGDGDGTADVNDKGGEGEGEPGEGEGEPGEGEGEPGEGEGEGEPEPEGGQTGDQCGGNEDCASNSCLFSDGADWGYCTIRCESFADCPTFWDCEEVGNATGKYCIED